MSETGTTPTKRGPAKRVYMTLKLNPDVTPDNRTPCVLYETEYDSVDACVKALIASGETKGQFAVISVFKRIQLGSMVVATDVKR